MATVTDLPDGGKKVVSGKSFEKLEQEANKWCYAVVERTIKLAYGVSVGSQKEIATKFCEDVLHLEPDASVVQGYFDYMKPDAGDLNDDDLRKQARAKALEAMVEENYGSPNMEGLSPKVEKGSSVTDDTLKDTFDKDNLAIQGRGIHWTVLYGYETAKEGYITTLLDYDPMSQKEGTRDLNDIDDLILFS